MPRTLSDDDLIEILEEIAQNSSNQSARIQAIRALKEMERGDTPQGAFEALDQLAPRRFRTKTAA